MPVYFAGWVNANATLRFPTSATANFIVSRFALTGSYRITVSTALTPRFLATVVTPVDVDRIARVAAFTPNGMGSFLIDIEIRDRVNGGLVDGAFTFIAIERSGS